jgi:hypothetical protein
MVTPEAHPSGLRGLWRRSVEIYRQYLRTLVGIMILPQILTYAALRALVGIPELIGIKGEGLIVIPGLLAVMALPCSVALAAAASAVSDAQLGRPVTFRAAYGRLGWKKSRALVNLTGSIVLRGAAFFAFICLPVVFMAIVAPLMHVAGDKYTTELQVLGVVLSLVLAALFVARYVVTVPVLMLEDIDSLRALERGLLLTKGKRLLAVGTGLLMMAIAIAPAMLIHLLASLAAAALKVGSGPPPLWLGWLEVAAGAAGQILCGPVWTILAALLYYDLKAGQESLGPHAAPRKS